MSVRSADAFARPTFSALEWLRLLSYAAIQVSKNETTFKYLGGSPIVGGEQGKSDDKIEGIPLSSYWILHSRCIHSVRFLYMQAYIFFSLCPRN